MAIKNLYGPLDQLAEDLATAAIDAGEFRIEPNEADLHQFADQFDKQAEDDEQLARWRRRFRFMFLRFAVRKVQWKISSMDDDEHRRAMELVRSPKATKFAADIIRDQFADLADG